MREQKKNEEMERIRRANEMLFQDKACPQCGARLAVCKKPYNSESFPSLNIVDANIESEFYCPECEQYFAAETKLANWHNTQTTKFNSDGRKYRFSKEFASRRILRMFLMLTAAMVMLLPVFTIQLSKIIDGFSISAWAMCVLSGVAIFVLGYFALHYSKMYRVCRKAFIEPATKGVIFCNGANVVYIPWQDFRIGSTMSMGNAEDAFAFDTAASSFLVNENMEDYKELALKIADNIKDIAKLDPKILHLVYA